MKHLIKTSFLFWLSCLFTACGSAEDLPEAMSQERLSEVVSFAFPAQDYERVLEAFEELEEDVRAQMVSQLEEAEVDSSEDDLELTLPVSHWHELVLEYQRWLVREESEERETHQRVEAFIEEMISRLDRAGYSVKENPQMVRWAAAYMEHAVAHASSFRSGHIRLRVVDQDGDLVDGVELRVSWSYPDWINLRARKERETLEVDGTHELPTRRSIGIHVEGRKDGYYRNRIFIAPDEHEEVPREATGLWQKIVLGEEITETDVDELAYIEKELLLRKKGEVVQLYRFDGELEVRADGSGRIMRLDPPDNRRPGTLVRERDGIMHDVENIENYIEENFSIRDVLLFTEFVDGKFADQTVIVVAQREVFYPGKMKLWLGDPEGGFQRSSGQISREVVLAPEEGYEQTLLFTFADVESGNVWNYFKVDRHYGKVRISERHSMEVSEDLDWVRFRLTFFLNPTPGDRNLETGR